MIEPSPAPATETSFTTGGIVDDNLNLIGLVWILAVVVCAATATAATIVVAMVLKVILQGMVSGCQKGFDICFLRAQWAFLS